MKKQSVFVVGAGVVGLSTAIRVLEAGYDVTLFADSEVFPTDPKTVKYTSFWAGAICNPGLGDSLSSRLEKKTMHIFARMVEEDPNVPITRHPVFGYAEVANPEDRKHDAEMKKLFHDFRVLDPNELPNGVASGVTFTIFFIDVPQYLAYLWHRFFFLGSRAFRYKLSSLSDLLSPTTLKFEPVGRDGIIADTTPGFSSFNSSAFVNCTGLGVLSLGGVNDTTMFPTCGETVLLRAQWITSGIKYSWKNGDLTYIIPRGSGVVVLGGTFESAGLQCTATLLPLSKRANGEINDLDVLEECVGLWPSRKDGVRVETSWLDGDKRFPVVHNSGVGEIIGMEAPGTRARGRLRSSPSSSCKRRSKANLQKAGVLSPKINWMRMQKRKELEEQIVTILSPESGEGELRIQRLNGHLEIAGSVVKPM
ncbi:hypothetical protein B0H14DRAFT_3146433 [Mycena olivaceomarginata]|nr:hypothetical protein B0H14DRAFT_3146433 [Mycena olivaceomarginata]